MNSFRALLRDDAIRRLPLWTVITVLNTSVLVGSIALGAARAGGGAGMPVGPLVLPLWLALAVYLSFGPIRTRCRELDLTLPLSARQLWLIHLAATVVGSAVVLGASGAVVATYGALLGLPWAGMSLVSLLALMLSATTLAVVLLQGMRLRAWRIPGTLGWALALVPTLVGLLVWSLVIAGGPSALTPVPAILAAALGLRIYHSVPEAFDLVPTGDRVPATARHPGALLETATEAGTWNPASRSAESPRPRLARWPILLTILYNVPPWGPFTLVVLCLFVALGGALLSNGVAAWVPDVEMRLIFLPFTVYIMFSMVGPLTYRLHHLDPLPVGRKALLVALLAPLALALLLGYGAGWATGLAAQPELVEFRVLETRHGTDRWVRIPAGYLEIAPAGEVPSLTAPWGETHPASSAPLSPRKPDGATLYSPFNTPDESSPAFEAWLVSRAVEAVYGRSVPPEELLERYFVVEGEQVVGVAEGGFTLRADHPDLVPKPGGPDLPVVLTLTAVPFLLISALFFSTFRMRIGNGARKVTFWSVLAVAMIGMIGHIPLIELGLLDPLGARTLFEKAILALGRSPETLAATWVLALTTIAAAYLLARRQFLHLELPAQPSKFTLVDWGDPNS